MAIAKAVELAQSTAQPGDKLRIPLPSTPNNEAQVLLKILYDEQPEKLLRHASMQDLRTLARICHRFAFERLLSMTDQARHWCLMPAVLLFSPAGSPSDALQAQQLLAAAPCWLSMINQAKHCCLAPGRD